MSVSCRVCPGCSVSGRSSVTLQSVSSGHSVSVVVLGLPERPEIVRLVTLVSAFLFSVGIPCSSILSLSSKTFTGLLMPRFQCGECIESNEIQLENIDISGHILRALFSISFTLVSHYSAFSSVRRTDVNVLNSLKHSRLSCERRRKQNNAILEWGDWRIMRGECDPKYRYSLFVSHYSLQSPQ